MSDRIDYNQLAYFFRYKGLDSMSNWPQQLKLLKKIHPEVAQAYLNLIDAQRTFDVLFDNMLGSELAVAGEDENEETDEEI